MEQIKYEEIRLKEKDFLNLAITYNSGKGVV
jgi:hypothetical protein